MSFTGESIKADTALQMGLVSEVLAPEKLMARAMEIAQLIAKNPPHAVRLAKQLIKGSEKSTLDETLDKSASFQAVCHAEPDHQEAIAAFFEKRDGNYRTR